MKKIIRKFWGVGLVVILLSTLFAGAAPVANAATLAWSVAGTPLGVGFTWQLNPGTDVANVTVAPNGDLFAVDTAALNRVYKSVNGGISWAPCAPVLDAGLLPAEIVDLKVSPSYATDNTVFVLANANAGATPQVYISTNGGLSFSVLGGTLTAAETGTSLAIAPNYSGGTGEVMAGTTRVAGAAFGNVYIWGRNGVQNWVATAAGWDVSKVAFSPNYAIDATRLCVSSNDTTGTLLNTLVASDVLWNATLPVAVTGGALISAAVGENGTALTAEIYRSTIAFPSDFNASSAFTRTCYVGITSNNTATDNVWRTTVGVGAILPTAPGTLYALANRATSLAYSGTSAAGTLFFGAAGSANVLSTATPTSAIVATSWGINTAGPTGANTTYVALANDYATSHKVYVGTTGAESAFSISDDAGVTFYQASLIDSAITAINDFQVASPTMFFMATNAGGVTTSVWKTVNAGTNWYRYYTIVTALPGILRLSPNFATDNTVMLGLVGSAAAGNVRVSSNAGVNWVLKTAPVTVADIAVKDMYTFYVANGAAASVQATANGGWTWQPAATTVAVAGAISSLKINLATGALLAGTTVGAVARSTNSNVSYVPLGAVGAAAVVVAFDANYATNGFMYAVPLVAAPGGSDVSRFGTGYLAGLALGTTGSAVDLLSAPDGTLYVSGNVTGVNRSINPTAGFPTLSLATWNNLATGAVASGKLAYVAGSNVIYAVSGALLFTYGDTLSPSTATSVPAQVSPANGAIFPASGAAVVTWNAVTGALSYQYQYATRADWADVVVGAAVIAPFTSATITPLAAGVTYSWMVRVLTPIVGPWSQAMTFLTQLAPVAPNAPGIVVGAAGTTGPGGTAVALNPTFAWGSIGGATGYEFQLASDAAMTAFVIDATGAKALPAITAYKWAGAALKNSATYYWRVRGISATSQTAWSNVNAFTTLDVPQALAPPVIITQMPAPTINIPAAPQATQIVIPAQPPAKEISPTYIWAIIIIGAVLVIAVIVLIVRTRRAV